MSQSIKSHCRIKCNWNYFSMYACVCLDWLADLFFYYFKIIRVYESGKLTGISGNKFCKIILTSERV